MAVAAQRHDWDLTLSIKNAWSRPAAKNPFIAVEQQLGLTDPPPPPRRFSLSRAAVSALIPDSRKG